MCAVSIRTTSYMYSTCMCLLSVIWGEGIFFLHKTYSEHVMNFAYYYKRMYCYLVIALNTPRIWAICRAINASVKRTSRSSWSNCPWIRDPSLSSTICKIEAFRGQLKLNGCLLPWIYLKRQWIVSTVDVGMLNTVKIYWADISCVSFCSDEGLMPKTSPQ